MPHNQASWIFMLDQQKKSTLLCFGILSQDKEECFFRLCKKTLFFNVYA